MAAFDIDAFFTPAAMAEVRAHDAVIEIMDGLALASLQEYALADAVGRWMFRDLGRSSLYLASVILDSTPAGLTAAGLTTVAEAAKVASRGRVIAFLRHGEAAGEIVIPPGAGPWTRRRLVLEPRFVDRLKRGNWVYARGVARVAPEAAPLVDRLSEDNYFRQFANWVGVASAAAMRLGTAGQGGETLFLQRDRGMSLLFRLMTSQPPSRRRLLEEAMISRSSLSREFEISRAHVNRLLSDAEANGLLTLPSHDRVVFSQTLSDDVERMMAVTLQVTKAALFAAAADLEAVEAEPERRPRGADTTPAGAAG